MIIGIAGKIGSGKSYLANMLQMQGWFFLDLDKVAHRALEALVEEITQEFGEEIVINGKLRRNLLAQKVFGVPGALERLEKITYPWIERETRRWLDEREGENRILEAVNLHKTPFPEEMELIIWVSTPFVTRLFWVMQRDGHTLKDTITRFRSQSHLGPKLFRGRTETYRVANSNNRRNLIRSLTRIPGINFKSG